LKFRLNNDRIVKPVVTRAVESVHGGTFDLHVYETAIDASEHLALVKGDLSQPGPVLVRVHAVNALADLLGIRVEANSSEGGSLIEKSMRMIEAEGRGVVVLIRDLRPKSVSDGIAARAGRPKLDGKPVKASGQERRLVEIGIGSQILRDLGVRDMVLLSNSPASVYVGLEGYGLKILETRKIE
jgi:3,4-dihydroxy 2-butanone 4-phosphate synthase / GTP cyclohydrolase II